MKKIILTIVLLLFVLSACSPSDDIDLSKMNQSERVEWFKTSSNEERKEVLTPQQYHVIVEKKMEASFLGKFSSNNNNKGAFFSAVCDYQLFTSEDKFDANSGYLDFENINLSNAQFKENFRTGAIEVYSICGEYIGYVRDDKSLVSGKHFVINSQALEFKKRDS